MKIPLKRLKTPGLKCSLILLLANTAPRNRHFAQDVVGQIHLWYNSTTDRAGAREGFGPDDYLD